MIRQSKYLARLKGDYVKAMHQMLKAPAAKDYLIASGQTMSLREFVSMAFSAAGLDPDPYLVTDNAFLRPSDLVYSSMDPRLIKEDLNWKAEVTPVEIVQYMYEERLCKIPTSSCSHIQTLVV